VTKRADRVASGGGVERDAVLYLDVLEEPRQVVEDSGKAEVEHQATDLRDREEFGGLEGSAYSYVPTVSKLR